MRRLGFLAIGIVAISACFGTPGPGKSTATKSGNNASSTERRNEPEAEAVVLEVAPKPTSGPLDRPKSQGRPVVSIGEQIITLPQLTVQVKDRIRQFGPGETLNRRQVITLARSVLKSMIIRSLVFQEASDKLGGPASLEPLQARLERTWDDQEKPALRIREGVATDDELRSRLARQLVTPESIRDEFVVRSIATELIERAQSNQDFDSFVETLRQRRPITSLMSPAELIATGRQAVDDAEVER